MQAVVVHHRGCKQTTNQYVKALLGNLTASCDPKEQTTLKMDKKLS